jgi:hypothetical protein
MGMPRRLPWQARRPERSLSSGRASSPAMKSIGSFIVTDGCYAVSLISTRWSAGAVRAGLVTAPTNPRSVPNYGAGRHIVKSQDPHLERQRSAATPFRQFRASSDQPGSEQSDPVRSIRSGPSNRPGTSSQVGAVPRDFAVSSAHCGTALAVGDREDQNRRPGGRWPEVMTRTDPPHCVGPQLNERSAHSYASF